MNTYEVFKDAKWIGNGNKYFSIVRRKFNIEDVKNISLRIIGLGYFECFVNGKRVSDELFQPLNSEYEVRHTSIIDTDNFTSFHAYFNEYDLKDYVKDGINTIAIYFGGGWYQKRGWNSKGYGFDTIRLIYRIFGKDKNGEFEFVSSKKDLIKNGYIKDYMFDHKPYELIDLRSSTIDAYKEDFNERGFKKAKEYRFMDTDFRKTMCPPDRVIEDINPSLIFEKDDLKVYDILKNTTGYPELIIDAKKGEKIEVLFSEGINNDNTIDEKYTNSQRFCVVSDGNSRTIEPLFIWYGFRYFSVKGNARVNKVKVVHEDIKQTGFIKTDNELINYIFETYRNTQITNWHSATPSDCPHIERRGYTGDGQLTQRACMYTFDTKELYLKWMEDIRDTQDKNTGRISNTAPFVFGSAGGYLGWGSAIVNVPYEYYMKYGDDSILKEYYPNMIKYMNFLDAVSKNGLIEKNDEDYIVLGEWCTPGELALDYKFVNTCQYINVLERMIEIEKIIGKDEHIALFKEKIEEKRKAVINNFMDSNGNFFNSIQAANAFAVNAGCENENTYSNLVKHYENYKELDTGIFGTKLLPRLLCEKGNHELAFDLILNKGPHSFYRLMMDDETTIPEYMPNSLTYRSKNHPMFGALVDIFYDFLIGIKSNAGMKEIEIKPCFIECVKKLESSVMTHYGPLEIKYIKNEEYIIFDINVPKGLKTTLNCLNKVLTLNDGINNIKIDTFKR